MSNKTVCIDAGHYGRYNPSPVVPGYFESEMNWKLQGKLQRELEKRGISVKTTRDDPARDLDLDERGRRAQGCDLFLSLHSNGAERESADYVIAYVQLDGKGDTLGQQLADKVAQLMGTKEKARIGKKKGERGEYYGVLRGSASVGVMGIILEHSFHTNAAAARWLLEDANLEKLASSEAQIIAEYLAKDGEAEQYYRIRKSWEDAASQIGAYTDPERAKKACPEGYKVFDGSGVQIYPAQGADSGNAVTLPVLRIGDKGASVKALQQLLIGSGYSCGFYGADGDFGNATQTALKVYQRDRGLEPDGICGVKTWRSLLGVQ